MARIILALTLVVALLAPPAAASHWTLYYAGVDESAGRTLEDDADLIRANGNPLNGRANKVVASGHVPGDGSLFLDAKAANRIPVGTGVTPDIFPSFAAEGLTGRPDLLLPGARHTSAWYGWWNDLDQNGRIADVHDARCGDTPCTDDEFLWRGLATDETLSMRHYSPTGTGTFSAQSDPSSNAAISMLDRTSREESEQGWIGGLTGSHDAPILTTIQTLVVVGENPVLGGSILDDANALIDVDTYQSLSPDAESLWFNVVHAPDEPQGTLNALVQGALAAALEATAGPTGIVSAISTGGVGAAAAFARRTTGPPDAKEPNHADDDFEGRATFGGVGDRLGSFNTYDGYVDGHHFYADVAAVSDVCAGAYARAPAITVAPGGSCVRQNADPQGANIAGARGAGEMLGFLARALIWRDVNLDTHIGTTCDRESEDFDDERNTCKDAPSPWPHAANFGEHRYVCEDSSVRASSFTLTPMGGPWPGVIVVRDVEQTTRVVQDQHWEVRTDDLPITLRWEDDCDGLARTTIYSRDAVLFPAGGSNVPVRVEATISLERYRDATLGIDVGSESVTDVDVLVATL